MDNVNIFEQGDNGSFEDCWRQIHKLMKHPCSARPLRRQLRFDGPDPRRPNLEPFEFAGLVELPRKGPTSLKLRLSGRPCTLVKPIDFDGLRVENRQVGSVVMHWSALVLKPGQLESIEHA